jgi:hypothetical protein
MSDPLSSAANDFDLLHDWASQLGCTAEELRSAMGESGRSMFEFSPSEQFELDFQAQS